MMANNTSKQWALFAVAVLLVVLFTPYLGRAANILWEFYLWGHGLLAPLFSGGGVRHIVLGILSLGLVPVVLAAIPGAIYWVLTKKKFAYFWFVVWAVLLILATLVLVHA